MDQKVSGCPLRRPVVALERWHEVRLIRHALYKRLVQSIRQPFCVIREPLADGILIQLDKNTLTVVLDGGQPLESGLWWMQEKLVHGR
ncbi:hypothetical protein D3C78_1334710 [compost metagenome]